MCGCSRSTAVDLPTADPDVCILMQHVPYSFLTGGGGHSHWSGVSDVGKQPSSHPRHHHTAPLVPGLCFGRCLSYCKQPHPACTACSRYGSAGWVGCWRTTGVEAASGRRRCRFCGSDSVSECVLGLFAYQPTVYTSCMPAGAWASVVPGRSHQQPPAILTFLQYPTVGDSIICVEHQCWRGCE